MRAALLATLSATLTGCSDPTGVFWHEAALWGSYSAVHLGADEADFHAVDATGALQRQGALDGVALDRFGAAGSDTARLLDVVEDGSRRALVATESTLYSWSDSTATELADTGEGTVPDARLTEGGAGWLVEDGATGACTLHWEPADSADPQPLPAAACAGTTPAAVDRTTPRLFVAAEDQLLVLEPGAPARTLDLPPADLQLWAPTAAVLVRALAGGTELRATDADGAEAWATELGQAIRAIDHLGTAGVLVVAVDSAHATGSGRVLLLDATTGDGIAAVDIPLAAVAVSGGKSAGHLVAVLPEELHLFSLHLDNASGAAP